MKTLLWLDDIRNPHIADWLMMYAPDFAYGEGNVVWVKDYDEFCAWIKEHGLPDRISFDHDLGIPNQLKLREQGLSKRASRKVSKAESKTGHDCAKWLVDYCMDNKVALPKWGVHSANPTGADNIRGLLISFENFLKNNS